MTHARTTRGRHARAGVSEGTPDARGAAPRAGQKDHIVGLLLDPNNLLNRSIIRGVFAFARTHCAWRFHRQVKVSPTVPYDEFLNWHGDGLIGNVDEPHIAHRLKSLGIPFVDITSTLSDTPMPRVTQDDESVGAAAANHLLERRFSLFAYYGGWYGWSEARFRGFANTLAAAGHSCLRAPHDLKRWSDNQRQIDRLAQWLRKLPRPIGIMGCSDDWAIQILIACAQAHIPVPDDVAVIGVNDDDLLCNLSMPPLSSVRIPFDHIGSEAARLLRDMLAGAPASDTPVLIPPLGITARGSTDVFRVSHPALSTALRYLRDHSHEQTSVPDLARHAGVSERTIERQFVVELGRTPLDEINRIRIERARSLLRETSLTVAGIAEAVGFGTVIHFHRVFLTTVGITPGAYRDQLALPDPR